MFGFSDLWKLDRNLRLLRFYSLYFIHIIPVYLSEKYKFFRFFCLFTVLEFRDSLLQSNYYNLPRFKSTSYVITFIKYIFIYCLYIFELLVFLTKLVCMFFGYNNWFLELGPTVFFSNLYNEYSIAFTRRLVVLCTNFAEFSILFLISRYRFHFLLLVVFSLALFLH